MPALLEIGTVLALLTLLSTDTPVVGKAGVKCSTFGGFAIEIQV